MNLSLEEEFNTKVERIFLRAILSSMFQIQDHVDSSSSATGEEAIGGEEETYLDFQDDDSVSSDNDKPTKQKICQLESRGKSPALHPILR